MAFTSLPIPTVDASYLADVPMHVATFADLASVTSAQIAVGAYIAVSGLSGALYQRVASGGHLDYSGSGGVLFDVLPRQDGTFCPDQIGAPSDGLSLATEYLQDLIAIAGADSVICGAPGAVYLIDNELNPLAGQKFYGNGATFKRAAQVVATLTTSAAAGAGPTTFAVDSAAGFKVGDYVTLTTTGENTDKAVHPITVIAGNNITISGTLTLSFTAGAQVVGAYHLFRSTVDDVEWRGWEFDGNRANWQTNGLRWETHVEIRASGARNVIEGCYFHDTPGEGLLFGGAASRAEGNTFLTTGGNPIHLSGGDDMLVANNYIDGANLIAVGTLGHEDGCVAWSLGCKRARIINNVCKNGLSGFGEISVDENSEATIIGNTVVDCDTPWEAVAFGENGAAVIVEGNRFYNSGIGDIGSTLNPSTEVQTQNRWTIKGNYFEGTYVKVQRTYVMEIEGNTFRNSDAQVALNPVTILIENATIARVRGNIFDGYAYGIYANAGCDWVEITGNTFRRGSKYSASLSAMTAKHADFTGNKIIGDTTLAIAGFYGVSLPQHGIARGNEMDIPVGAKGIYGNSDAIIDGNIIRCPIAVLPIRLDGGTSGAVVVRNMTEQAISNGGGALNTVENNYIIAALA